jgi:spermidine synthase
LEISNTFAENSKDVFIIGHGIGTLTKQFEIAKKEVKVSEIDNEVLEVSKEYFQYNGNSVEIGDGRKILKDQRELIDLIVLDAYHNTYQIPFHLISREFFTLTREKMREDGVLIINAIGTPKEDIVLESINTTLKSVFQYVYIFARENEDQLQNLTIVASNKPHDVKKIKEHNLMNIKEGKLILDRDTKLKYLN